jgi:hypothetical protein
MAELGLGHLVSETIATSSLKSKKKRQGISQLIRTRMKEEKTYHKPK